MCLCAFVVIPVSMIRPQRNDEFEMLTPDIVSEALTKAGISITPKDLEVEAREDKWLVRLPGQQLAWFAMSDEARARLRDERRLLQLLGRRCTFGVPRVLFEDPNGEFDVRTMVPGSVDPQRVYSSLRRDPDVARSIGRQIGAILAEQHTRIDAADVAGWLPRRLSWPESREWVRQRLAKVVDDRELIAVADIIMKKYEDVSVAEADLTLVHTDVGFHNLAMDPDSNTVHGLFDYENAAWADRHHDFRYLLFDTKHEELLDAAISVYEPVVGRVIDRPRVRLYNAACALTFLANRVGTKPTEDSCGRTLAEDLEWSRHAIESALNASGPRIQTPRLYL